MLHIERALPEDWPAAFALALAHLPPLEHPARLQHCLNLLENGVLHPDGIWIARSDDTIFAVQICVPLAGSACLFWAPSAIGAIADALVAAALSWCRTIDCKIAQAIAKPGEGPGMAPLLRAGFRRVTCLEQWELNLNVRPPRVESYLRFERFRESISSQFAATLERTYEGTLDCPELNGVRTIDEIIAGHRGQGKFHADHWWLAFDGVRPAGVLLLVEMPDGLTWELAYVGLVPEYRRRGFARALLTHALNELPVPPATRLILAVDERNAPARRLYQSLGFVETETNEVYLYLL